ncbi:hypothetical protein [Mesorhizobium shangrilense]|uniref:Uncharacterized protein n=1 Tax=Mesorhizobium shangrilense TaxID=460060 RepID=A0ABV2DHV1_9HYPH
MRSEDAKAKLLVEFPELGNPEIIFQKEVFAHFGLAFLKFGLVEHSLINVLTFWSVGEGVRTGKIRSRLTWESAFDSGYEQAVALTFGNLTKKVCSIAEFSDLRSSFADAKRLRDYFAHHFMRDEAAYFESEEGCWLLLTKIAEVRHQVLRLEDALKPRFEAMRERLKLPRQDESQLNELLAAYYREAREDIAAGSAKVGWEKNAL